MERETLRRVEERKMRKKQGADKMLVGKMERYCKEVKKAEKAEFANSALGRHRRQQAAKKKFEQDLNVEVSVTC